MGKTAYNPPSFEALVKQTISIVSISLKRDLTEKERGIAYKKIHSLFYNPQHTELAPNWRCAWDQGTSVVNKCCMDAAKEAIEAINSPEDEKDDQEIKRKPGRPRKSVIDDVDPVPNGKVQP